jgi:hypothetical protein
MAESDRTRYGPPASPRNNRKRFIATSSRARRSSDSSRLWLTLFAYIYSPWLK